MSVRVETAEWLDNTAAKLRDAYGQSLWQKHTRSTPIDWNAEEQEAKKIMMLYATLGTTARFLCDGFPDRKISLTPVTIQGVSLDLASAAGSIRTQIQYLGNIGIREVQAVKRQIGDTTEFDLRTLGHQAILRDNSSNQYWVVQKGEYFGNLINQKLAFLRRKHNVLTRADMHNAELAVKRIMYFMEAFGEPDVGSTMPGIRVMREDMIKVTPDSVTATLTPTTMCWAVEPILIPGAKYLIRQIIPQGVTVEVNCVTEQELPKYHLLKRPHQWTTLKTLLETSGNQNTFMENWSILMNMGIALGSVNSRPDAKLVQIKGL